MKVTSFVAILLCLLVVAPSFASEQKGIAYKVIADKRLYLRDATDSRSSLWTASPGEVDPLLAKFGVLDTHEVVLKQGEILAVFLNDKVENDLVGITQSKKGDDYFAEYVDSGMKIKIERRANGGKLTHMTAVVLSPPTSPNRLVLRETSSNKGTGKG